MDLMKKIDKYLSQALVIDKRIKALEDTIRHLQDKLEFVGSTLSETKVQTSPGKDPKGDIVAELVDAQEEYRQDILKLLDYQQNIKRLIEKIPNDKQRLIFHERFIGLKTFEAIANDNNYSLKNVFKLRKAGFKVLADIWENIGDWHEIFSRVEEAGIEA